MKQVFITLGLITAILSAILSVLSLYNFAIYAGIAALIFALMAFYLSKKSGDLKKIIPFTFLLTFMALSITLYKTVFIKVESANTEDSIIKEQPKQDSIQ